MGRVRRAISRWLDSGQEAWPNPNAVATQHEKKATVPSLPQKEGHAASQRNDLSADRGSPSSPPAYSLSPTYFSRWGSISNDMRQVIEKQAQCQADEFTHRLRRIFGEDVIRDEKMVNSTMRRLCVLVAMTASRHHTRRSVLIDDLAPGGLYEEDYKAAYVMMASILDNGVDPVRASRPAARTCILHFLTRLCDYLAGYRLKQKEVECAFYLIHVGHLFIMEFEKRERIVG